MTFEAMWDALVDVGRAPDTGGYRRYAWTPTDHTLREWFVAEARSRGLSVVEDRAGNLWAWWGDPDVAPGVVTGSHLDSVPDGGAYDGPLGVVSAFAALDTIRASGVRPARPLGIVAFADEEGARFGVACVGSRLLTGALDPDRALGLRDADGITLAEALIASGRRPLEVGRDDAALRRIGCVVELHVEQGRGLAGLDRPVAVGTAIWPHGRFRAEFVGQANHAGTTALADRRDPTLAHARLVLAARAVAERRGVLATCGKVRVEPNGVNAIPSHVTAWLDVRGAAEQNVRAAVDELTGLVHADEGSLTEESWTGDTPFDADLSARIAAVLGEGTPRLATGAGHDAGILATAGIPSAMLFVRNPSGVSHSPVEYAERVDCEAGVAALAAVLAELLA